MPISCPNCGCAMQQKEYPDVTTDVCSSCGGVFLDKGELNAIAVGMGGDIEYCSIDAGRHADRFETRICPKCPGEKMQKINLLRLSDLIFDYCPACGGFWLWEKLCLSRPEPTSIFLDEQTGLMRSAPVIAFNVVLLVAIPAAILAALLPVFAISMVLYARIIRRYLEPDEMQQVFDEPFKLPYVGDYINRRISEIIGSSK